LTVATFGWFRGEGFGLIVEDLLTLPAGPGVIAEDDLTRRVTRAFGLS
jgi:hypothetical protein